MTRLVNDGLLVPHSVGRRSFYGVATDSMPLFRQADARIYGSRRRAWDQSWTIVVIDGTESTAARRATLRQRLTWAGLGSSPQRDGVAGRSSAGGRRRHRPGRRIRPRARRGSGVGAGTIDEEELARRCAPLDEVADQLRRVRRGVVASIAATIGSLLQRTHSSSGAGRCLSAVSCSLTRARRAIVTERVKIRCTW